MCRPTFIISSVIKLFCNDVTLNSLTCPRHALHMYHLKGLPQSKLGRVSFRDYFFVRCHLGKRLGITSFNNRLNCRVSLKGKRQMHKGWCFRCEVVKKDRAAGGLRSRASRWGQWSVLRSSLMRLKSLLSPLITFTFSAWAAESHPSKPVLILIFISCTGSGRSVDVASHVKELHGTQAVQKQDRNFSRPLQIGFLDVC